MQAALRYMQLARQRFGRLLLFGAGSQQLAHALHQRFLALIGAHLNRQGALQHAVECGLIACQRGLQPACLELKAGHGCIELQIDRGKQHLIHPGMLRCRKWEACVQQGNGLVHQPAGKAVNIAQHGNQTKLAHGA